MRENDNKVDDFKIKFNVMGIPVDLSLKKISSSDVSFSIEALGQKQSQIYSKAYLQGAFLKALEWLDGKE